MSVPIIRNNQQLNILNELKAFIGGATRTTKNHQFELAKSALSLLKSLPAARDAVLEYFCTVFDTATQNFIVRIEVIILYNFFYLKRVHFYVTLSDGNSNGRVATSLRR